MSLSVLFFIHRVLLLTTLIGAVSFEKDIRARTGIIETSTGPIRGKEVSVFGKEIEVYLGIPFAQAPIGELRFKNPVPVKPWTDVLDATQKSNSCPQLILDNPLFEEWYPKTPLSEDCLYLNLWVPKHLREKSSNTSVMIWIHGGGFNSASATLDAFDAAYFTAVNDVIFVSMNYRLGPLGFLYLGSEDAPGNMGLLDQQLAIAWTKENAALFGGNPDSLTVFGISAGGASASFHLLSPVSRHLARRFILQSGTANAPWSYMPPEAAKQNALRLANLIGCLTDDSSEASSLAGCLRKLSAESLISLQYQLVDKIVGIPFVPTIDGSFLPSSPSELLANENYDHVEAIIGTAEDEGSLFAFISIPQIFGNSVNISLSSETFVSMAKGMFATSPWSDIERELILFQYTDWERFGDEGYIAKRFCDLLGDYLFTCPANDFTQKLTMRGGTAFHYSFHQKGKWKRSFPWMGSTHGDDLEFVFGHPLTGSALHTESDRAFSLKFMAYLTSFAKTGKPSLEGQDWPPYSADTRQYMVLHGSGDVIQSNGPRGTFCAFWNNLIPKIRSLKEESSLCSSRVESLLDIHAPASVDPSTPATAVAEEDLSQGTWRPCRARNPT